MEKITISLFIPVILLCVLASGCLDLTGGNGIFLEFEFGECDLNPYNDSELGVKNFTWLDNSILQIDATDSIICNFKIEGADYEIDDKNLTLLCNYYNPTPGMLAECYCTFCLVYTFYNITQQNYQIGFGQTDEDFRLRWGQPWL